nr:MAG TPA: hypothetical protein [Caudoviricetes sp.]
MEKLVKITKRLAIAFFWLNWLLAFGNMTIFDLFR